MILSHCFTTGIDIPAVDIILIHAAMIPALNESPAPIVLRGFIEGTG
jgi:hypothetical protein